jgi:sec-independent protein translocase protein TatA
MINSMQAFMGLPGGAEWIIILVIAVLVFGRRLPEIARGMGKSITEFKKGIKDTEDDIHKAIDESDKVADEHAKKKDDAQHTD